VAEEHRVTEDFLTAVCRTSNLVEMKVTDWPALQAADEECSAIKAYLEAKAARRRQIDKLKAGNKAAGKDPGDGLEGVPGVDMRKHLGPLANTPAGQAINRQRDNFTLKSGLVYLKVNLPDQVEQTTAFVVPKNQRHKALDGCHRDAGHQGQHRTFSLVQERFWWPQMAEDVRKKLKDCEACRRFDGRAPTAPLQPIHASGPLDLVHLDFLTLETTKDPKKPKIANLLVITDHYTRHATVIKVPDQKAITTARAFHAFFIAVHGAPRRILTDRGLQFSSKVVTQLCKLYNIDQTRTTAYHPAGNGQVERFNRTLIRMLGKLPPKKKAWWPGHLAVTTQAYNSTRCPVTGYSPHFLMYGRRPRLPVDLYFPTIRNRDQHLKVPEYVGELHESLKDAFAEATKQSQAEAARHKKLYDRSTSTVCLSPGDKVWVRTDAVVGRKKLQDRWSGAVHTVVRQMAPDSPVYWIEDSNGQFSKVHRNRLLCVTTSPGEVPLVPPDLTAVPPVVARVTTAGKPTANNPPRVDDWLVPNVMEVKDKAVVVRLTCMAVDLPQHIDPVTLDLKDSGGAEAPGGGVT
jgi:transposase InsO family protein